MSPAGINIYVRSFNSFFSWLKEEGHSKDAIVLRQIKRPATHLPPRTYMPPAAAALGVTTDQYRLASVRYDLSKLRAKGLVERVPHTRRYRLLAEGYSICLVFLKLFERVYAPLTAGLLSPIAADARLAEEKRHQLDRLYQRIVDALDTLVRAVGLKTAA